VILDVMLPKMNGFEVCQQIRANPGWRGIRILMLTARGRDREIAKGLGLGADAYVTKPFSTRDLVAQVKQLLGQGP
jgi:DNA-binding response OmpR family regulator